MTTISKLIAKLRDPEYRKSFVVSQINIGIPFQIRSLMRSRGWTQQQLAERTGMLQPRISAMMKPGNTRPNIETLRRLAEAFDCGLMVWFVPFSELVMRSERFDAESFAAKTFQQEDSEGRFEQIQSCLAGDGIPVLIDSTNRGPAEIKQSATVETEQLKPLPNSREYIWFSQVHTGGQGHAAESRY